MSFSRIRKILASSLVCGWRRLIRIRRPTIRTFRFWIRSGPGRQGLGRPRLADTSHQITSQRRPGFLFGLLLLDDLPSEHGDALEVRVAVLILEILEDELGGLEAAILDESQTAVDLLGEGERIERLGHAALAA